MAYSALLRLLRLLRLLWRDHIERIRFLAHLSGPDGPEEVESLRQVGGSLRALVPSTDPQRPGGHPAAGRSVPTRATREVTTRAGGHDEVVVPIVAIREVEVR